MDFSGPEAADLADVRSLNTAFLDYLVSPSGEGFRREMPIDLQGVVGALTRRHVQRLSTVPFLLMSCRERDDNYWQGSSSDQSVRDLFTLPAAEAEPLSQIACATLGFLWQLSRRNLYAARMVCGASLGWCEQLASKSLLDVLERAAVDSQILSPRLTADMIFWNRLLGAGLSSNIEIRRAAHLSALQTVLSPIESSPTRRFRSAACRTSVPALQVRAQADK
ncbi:MAG: hypothetical protein ACR2QL_01845 [Woeseiaceae bacterium]